MHSEALLDLTQTQRDRLAYIEMRLRFLGDLRRQDLVGRFGIQVAAATRDIGIYKELAPANILYDRKSKVYLCGAAFRAVFDFSAERVLAWLTRGFGDGEPMQVKSWVACEAPTKLSQPNLDVLASITKAIYQKTPIGIDYSSISSGHTKREIVPFALIDNGLR